MTIASISFRSTVSNISPRPLVLIGAVLAGAVLSVVMPFTAQAQVIQACFVPKSGTVYRVAAPSAPAACKPGHVAFEWNMQGLQGDQGPQGPQGEPGPAGGSDALTLPLQQNGSTATPLLSLTQTGTGPAARFQAGSGSGVSGRAITGVGVQGFAFGVEAGAAGVRAEHFNSTGTALEITKGVFRVVGAGANTATTAFILKGNGLAGTGAQTMTIDNPLVNGDPDAILIVTRRASGLESDRTRQLAPFYIFYDGSAARWKIRYEMIDQVGFDDINPVPSFSVLVIKN